jgi:hypothetical protein
MAIKPRSTTGPTWSKPHSAAPAAPTQAPANRLYIFGKTCTNDHGTFAKGDKARGAFAPELVAAYLAAGILVPAPVAPEAVQTRAATATEDAA